MSSIPLTSGIATRLYSASPDDSEFFDKHYVLQILGLKTQATKPKAGGNNVYRSRVILSDGLYYLQAMYTTQEGEPSAEDLGLVKFAVARIRITCSSVQNKRLLVISDAEILETLTEKIGEPVNLNKAEGEETPMPDSKPVVKSAPTTKPAGQPFAQSKPAPQKQVQRSGGSNGTRITHPIEGLSPYGSGWTIKARCTQKSDMKKWANSRGDGQLFNVTLMDDTGEIRGTAFNTVAEALFQQFQEGNVYYVSKARVNVAKKMFSNLSNDYELSFDKGTEVELCTDSNDLPVIKYNFIQLNELSEKEKDTTCDVIGLVKEVGMIGEITSKATNRTTKKRELTLVDQSGFSVRLTLWGKHAETYDDGMQNPVIAFKGVRVGDFGGRSLSMVSSSVMTVNPEIQEGFTLKGWFDNDGKDASFQAHSIASSGLGGGFKREEMKSLADVREKELGQTADKPAYFSSRATIMHIKKDNITYPACPSGNCSKKVIESNGRWRCEKCNKDFDAPVYRYIISMAVADWSGQAWFNGFNDVGNIIFGMDANTFVDKEAQDAVTLLFHKASGQTYNFACRAKTDSFNDQSRVRYGISRIDKLNFKEECDALLETLSSDWAK